MIFNELFLMKKIEFNHHLDALNNMKSTLNFSIE